MNKYKLSVIIPVYNAEEFLPRTIDSVLKSTLDNIEIIVVDDCSQGNCKEIVDKYENIKYIRHKKNQGLFAARCTGIKNASGEYIVHLDADDWIKNKTYEYSYNKAKETTSDVVFFNVIQSDEDGKQWIEPHNIIKEFSNKSGQEILDYVFLFQSNRWIWHVCWNKIIKREIAISLLTYVEDIKHLNMYEDLLWSICLFLYLKDSNSFSAIEYTGIHYFRHKESITKQNSYNKIVKKLNDINCVMLKSEELLKQFKMQNTYLLYFKQLKYRIISMYFKDLPLEYIYKHPIYYLKNYLFIKFYNKKFVDKTLLEFSADIIIEKLVKDKVRKTSIFGLGEFALILLDKLKQNQIIITSFTVSKADVPYYNYLPILEIKDSLTQNDNFVIASLGSIDQIINALQKENIDKKELSIFGRV